MGSRITRTVFRNEINRPIDQTKGKQIFNIATYFLAFLSILAFFLYGYLYRPYLPLNQYLVLLLIVGFFLIQKQTLSAPLAVVSGFSLVVVFFIAKIIGYGFMSIKGALILTTILFASDCQQSLMLNQIGKQFLLWLQWQSFAIGLTLSHTVQKHTQTDLRKKPSQQDDLMISIVFCVLAFMGVYLAVMGVKYLLKNKKKDQSSHIPEQRQEINWKQLIVTGLLLISAFSFEKGAALTLSEKLLAVLLPVLIKISFELVKRLEYISLVVYLLAAISFVVQISTQNEQSIDQILEVVKLIAVNLLVLDSFGLWNLSCPTLEGKHSLIIPVWFITFCFCWLWDQGSYFYNIHPFIMQLISFVLYAILLYLSYRQKPSPYEALP